MPNIFNTPFKIGILGGGQLGKMLGQAASPWDLHISVLDADRHFPAAATCTEFVVGDFRNYDDVLAFGRQVDLLTIEIESVNSEALHQLVSEGLTVHPHPTALDLIKDKGDQKQFYKERGLPSSSFELFADRASILKALDAGSLSLPFVQKLRTGGYDGRGVAVIRRPAELELLMDGPSVVEELVDIDKELAVIVARNESGAVAAYPPVEMDFNPEANLVEWLLSPAQIDDETARRATELARQVIEAYGICGLLAVEMFLTPTGELLVNEVAPRPHNSGHHTIDSSYTSQFEQHLRAILNLPLGSTHMKTPSVMVNLLGEPGYEGQARYEGMEKVLALEGVKPHLYGKVMTKPFRKMGHVTILDSDLDRARTKARQVKDLLKVIA